MARIRSIKPEFWTDGRIVKMPLEVRLFYIGMWNFADDWGVLEDDPDSLKLRIMPADDVDARSIIDVLVAEGRVRRATSPDGSRVLVIYRWAEHQRIDKRSDGRWGNPADFAYFPTSSTEIPPPPPPSAESPRVPPSPAGSPAGEEGSGEDRNGTELTLVAQTPPVRDLRRVVFELWQEVTEKPNTKLDDKRRLRIDWALKNYPLDDVLDAIRGVGYSRFHQGDNDRNRRFVELDLILRDARHLEELRDLYRGAEAPVVKLPRGADAAERQARELGILP